MQSKIIEVRDRATYLPVLATKLTSEDKDEHRLLRDTGYGDDFPLVMMCALNAPKRAAYDPFTWGDRTFHEAHLYIQKHYDELTSGDVVDIEFILGEVDHPKTPQGRD